MTKPPPDLVARSRRLLRRWSKRWGLSGLESAVTITLSTRLHRSLGRCRPAQGLITLRPDLASSFDAVLCHEAAHVAAFVLHGRTVRPHGAEWASLVAAVGFDPVVRTRVAGTRPRPPRPLGYRFEHRCPVCQSVRLARRRMTTWRCAECVDAGLDGVMDIRPHPSDRATR